MDEKEAPMARLTLEVDRDLCELSTVCTRHAPDLLEMGDDDQLRVLVAEITPEQRERADAAVERCPRAALRLIETE
jgi:ferredoxin